ncbi:MAG: hypothetical protein HFI75_01555 [Lachnospiraceae bacterium]|nr:hypothetical protein [Lachnospiraceae bacterium]
MKKRVLSLALCFCMSAVLATGCATKGSSKKENESTEEKDVISVDDDHAENLHKILMKKTGNEAMKHTNVTGYENMQLEVEDEVVITDEVFQENLNSLLKEYPYAFSGQAVSGDTVNIDYTGYMDGATFDGGSGTGFDLEIGSGQFIPGFEDQLIGMNIGETKTIDVTFPQEYKNNTALAGKPAQFKVTLNYLQKGDGTVSELTDQWVAAYLNKVGGTVTDATVNGFKDYYRSEMEKQSKQLREQNVQTALESKLLEITELKEVPTSQNDYYTDMVKTNIESNIVNNYQITMEEYLSQIGMTQEEYDAEIQSIAKDTMKGRYSIIYIAETEELIPTEADYTAVLQTYADNYSMSVEEFRSSYQKDYQLDIYFETYAKKVMDKLLETAVITPPQEGGAASGDAAEVEN